MKFGFDWPGVSEEKIVEKFWITKTDDGRAPEDGYTISSPCEYLPQSS